LLWVFWVSQGLAGRYEICASIGMHTPVLELISGMQSGVLLSLLHSLPPITLDRFRPLFNGGGPSSAFLRTGQALLPLPLVQSLET